MSQLVKDYADLPLGGADASVADALYVELAARLYADVLTDHRLARASSIALHIRLRGNRDQR